MTSAMHTSNFVASIDLSEVALALILSTTVFCFAQHKYDAVEWWVCMRCASV